MKWENDKYRFLKDDIFDSIVQGLQEADAEKITTKKVFDSIDLLFEKLLEGITNE
jgi:hypothetical protein